MDDLQFTQILATTIIVATGACLQCIVGFGVATFAAPLLFLINTSFVPGPMIMASFVLTVLLLVRERVSLRFDQVRWSVIGNVPGAILAGVALEFVSAARFDLIFGMLIVSSVLISVCGYHPSINRVNSAMVGALSGFMGTCTSVGGPPIALLYQKAELRHARANLSAYFLFACLVALGTLYCAGHLAIDDFYLFTTCMPGIILGFMVSGKVNRFVSSSAARPLILAVAGIAGIAAICRGFYA